MRKYEAVEWHTRLDWKRPYQTVRAEGDEIRIALFPGNENDGVSFALDRADARLLAKRINSCLNATVKK